MSGTTAVLLVMGAVCVTIITFLLLIVLLRRRSPFNKRHRANALAALEGGRRSESSSMTELEKAPVPSPSRHNQSRYNQSRDNPSRHNAAASQTSIPSIIMTAALAGPGISKPAPARKSQIYRQSALRQSILAVGEPGPEFKESGLLPLPPTIGQTNRSSRGSKTWSILSIGGWQKRKTVRLTHFAM